MLPDGCPIHACQDTLHFSTPLYLTQSAAYIHILLSTSVVKCFLAVLTVGTCRIPQASLPRANCFCVLCNTKHLAHIKRHCWQYLGISAKQLTGRSCPWQLSQTAPRTCHATKPKSSLQGQNPTANCSAPLPGRSRGLHVSGGCTLPAAAAAGAATAARGAARWHPRLVENWGTGCTGCQGAPGGLQTQTLALKHITSGSAEVIPLPSVCTPDSDCLPFVSQRGAGN